MSFEKCSHSSINSYVKCPALFYYRYILQLRPRKRPLPLVFGSALHKGLELYEQKRVDPITVFEKDFKYDEILWETYKGEPLSDEDALEKFEGEIDNGIRLLEHFLEERENKGGKLFDYKVLHTEKKFKRTLDPIKGSKCRIKLLSGVVDVITKDEWIYDYKTSSKKYKQEDVDNPLVNMQPTIYYIWYYLTYGKLPKGFKYIVFMKKRKKDPIDVITTFRTIKDMQVLYRTINQVKSKVDKKQFNRNHGKYAFCDCFKLEEYFNSLREISYVRSNRKRQVVFP